MEQPLADEVFYYYDGHPTEEDLMSETPPHARVVHYLMEVLSWAFHDQVCAIHENYGFYQTSNENEPPYAPDIAIIKGLPEQDARSYRVGVYGPPPQIAFEFASEETWRKDLLKKPLAYARMGIAEYYAYDPNQPPLPLSRRSGRRLFGWQRDRATGMLREMLPDRQGRLWSMRLDSYLVPDGKLLRLTDLFGNPRLTEAEEEKRRADEERARAEAALQRANVLAEMLRDLGVDPDQFA